MSAEYDAIVIGGGHNGLVNAAYLARAGLRVLVLERRHLVGGATVTEEPYPGYKYSVFSYVVSILRPEIIQELNLTAYGLKLLPLPSTFTPLPNGDFLYRGDDHYHTLREIRRHAPRDADAYELYGRKMHFMAKAVKPVLALVPPDPASRNPAELLRLARLAGHLLGIGRDNFHTLVKLMTMSAADFLEEWFEFDPLVATMSSSGIIGTYLGPRWPGTAYVLLHHYMGEIDGVFRAWGFAKGGTGGLAQALAAAARALGAEIRTEAAAEQLIMQGSRVVGVALSDGSEIRAPVVVSSLDPRRTFLELADPELLPQQLREELERFRFIGSSGKVNLALDGAPEFACWPGAGPHLRGAISISPSVDYLETAYDQAKYGQFSRRPFIDIVIPSMIDPDMAPPGKHVMSCFVQYAPYHLRKGNWEQQREAFGDAVVDTLAEYIPNLKQLILHRQVLTPLDIERIIGLSEGNIFQGELSLSQLFFLRPAPGYADYRTPLRGYYQCGSAAHPGGGITGAPGKLAALEILRDLRLA